MLNLNPGFTLIEGGKRLSAADIAPRGGRIAVADAGVAGVVAALIAGEAWFVRDPTAESGSVTPGTIGLQTSGTTGTPKWVLTTLDTLIANIKPGDGPARWLLTFNPGSFAGVQVILSAMIGGHTLIAPSYGASVADMAELAVQEQATHISGTPTFWRAFLMVLGDRTLALKSATLGGEAADQAILDAVHARFLEAALRHIYATTELGRIFSVADGQAGFPAAWLGERLSISDRDTLLVSGMDTGDVIETVGDRVLFRGRIDAMVNIGGVKVFPETVEAHLLQLSCVQEARVSAKASPITGHILTAEIVSQPFSAEVEATIRSHIAALPRAMRPASIRFVEAVATGASGKKLRT